MVKVNAPLFSMNASGTLADTAVFSTWKGRPYVRERVIPSNPKTRLQTSVRAMMKFVTQAWAGLTAQQKSTWEDLARQTNISPFNAYVAENLKLWRQSLYPGKAYPVTGFAPYPGKPTIEATGGFRQATVTITKGTGETPWGYAIHRATTSNFLPTIDNVIAVVQHQDDGAQYIDRPIAPGTYYYKATAFTATGAPGQVSDPAQADVT